MISFVIPYRESTQDRKAILDWNLARLRALFPTAQIVLGQENNTLQPFNRSQAINNGIKRCIGKYIFIVDGDTVFNREVIEDSLHWLDQSEWVIPYETYCSLAPNNNLLEQNPNTMLIEKDLISESKLNIYTHPFPVVSGLLGFKAEDIYATGGFDERYIQWGMEDWAFHFTAIKRLGKTEVRLPYNIYHIWHPRGQDFSNPYMQQNQLLYTKLKKDFDNTFIDYLN